MLRQEKNWLLRVFSDTAETRLRLQCCLRDT